MSQSKMNEIDWTAVQHFYDEGHSGNDCTKHFGFSWYFLDGAVRSGLLKKRSKEETNRLANEKHRQWRASKETRQKMSIARKDYLIRTGKNPWSCAKRKSFGCETLKSCFVDAGLEFTEEFQPLLEQKRHYSIDIAFVDAKIGVEFNGKQHYQADGNLTLYHQERHNLIVAAGWELLEIPFNKVFVSRKLQSPYVNSLIEYLRGRLAEEAPGTDEWVDEKTLEIIRPSLDHPPKWPTKEVLQDLVSKMSCVKIAKHFGVGGGSVSRWLKWYGIKAMPIHYWRQRDGKGIFI